MKTLNSFSNWLCFSSELLSSFLRVIKEIVPVRRKGGGGGCTLLSSISVATKGMGFENGIDFDHYAPKSKTIGIKISMDFRDQVCQKNDVGKFQN